MDGTLLPPPLPPAEPPVLAPAHGVCVPALVAAAGERASVRFLEFFAGTIRNPHTRRAYGRAVADFLTWCEAHGVTSIAAICDATTMIDASAVASLVGS